jgi:VIT1/CCC1 family predicted Fe2+/Mn2+ transporter
MDTTTQPAPAEAPTRDGLWPMPPGPPHEERHFTQHEAVRDIIAGAAEGPAVPFAVAAGLVAAGASAGLVVAAGLAVAAAGGVASGLRRALDARDEAAHYAAERRREEEETVEYTDRERWEVAAILHRYGVRGDALRLAVDAVCADKTRWVDFMMRLELDLKEPEPRRAARAGLLGGLAHVAAGALPVLPFLLTGRTGVALALSALLGAGALAGLGWAKALGRGLPPLGGVVQLLGIGAAAALAGLVFAGFGGR